MTPIPTVASCLTAAIGYALKGWPVLPLHSVTTAGDCTCGNVHCGDSSGKHPRTLHGLKDASVDPAAIVTWWGQWPDANVGVATGGQIVVLDVDTDDGGDDSLRALEAQHGAIPTTIEAITGGGGRHIVFAAPAAPVRNSAGRLGTGLDIRADGGYIVAPPSLHISGNCYEWDGSHHPDDMAPASMPSWLLGLLAVAPTNGQVHSGQPTVIPSGQRNSRLASIAGSMRRQGVDEPAILASLREINSKQCQPPLPDLDIQRIAASISNYPPAVSNGQGPVLRPLTDLGNAERLSDQHGADIRYTSEADWHAWNSNYWERDTTGEIARRAFATVRHIAQEAATIIDPDLSKATLRFATTSESKARIESMMKLAQSLPTIAQPFTEFDQHPWLLTSTNGTVDLATGTLRPHERGDLITKATSAPFDPAALAPIWDAFLDKIMASNTALIAFLRRAIGYSLTGSTRERAVFILHGSGGNGKTTFLRTIQAVLGDGYGQRTPIEMFMKRKEGAIPSDIARLRGARFAYASESEDGRQLSEATIKDLAGDEPITARFMHRDWFQFRPEVKLWLGTNHRPAIRGTDNAIWDRIKLIPFAVRIPDAERDKDLEAKLRAEFPGILAWAVRGCLEWQQHGLGVPEEVRLATSGYREEMDTFRCFLTERCVLNKSATATGAEMWHEYQDWCQETGEYVGTKQRFGRRLIEEGIAKGGHTRNGNLWIGVGIAATPQQASIDIPVGGDESDECDAESDCRTCAHAHGEKANSPSHSSLSSQQGREQEEKGEIVDINRPWEPGDGVASTQIPLSGQVTVDRSLYQSLIDAGVPRDEALQQAQIGATRIAARDGQG